MEEEEETLDELFEATTEVSRLDDDTAVIVDSPPDITEPSMRPLPRLAWAAGSDPTVQLEMPWLRSQLW